MGATSDPCEEGCAYAVHEIGYLTDGAQEKIAGLMQQNIRDRESRATASQTGVVFCKAWMHRERVDGHIT